MVKTLAEKKESVHYPLSRELVLAKQFLSMKYTVWCGNAFPAVVIVQICNSARVLAHSGLGEKIKAGANWKFEVQESIEKA